MDSEVFLFIQQYHEYTYLAVFGVLLLCGLGLPLPEDITLVAGGYAVYLAEQKGFDSPQLLPMIAVGLVGVLFGDTFLFLVGKFMGPKVQRVWPFRKMLTPKRMKKVEMYFSRYGVWTAFFARFAAGVRAPTYLIAGSAGMRFRTFFGADLAAALISVPLWVWLAWKFGAQLERIQGYLLKSKFIIGGVIITVIVYFVVKSVIRKRREASQN